jgi:hypothetical protein
VTQPHSTSYSIAVLNNASSENTSMKENACPASPSLECITEEWLNLFFQLKRWSVKLVLTCLLVVAIGNSRLYETEWLDARRKWIDIVVEVRGLPEVIIPAFTWRKWGKLQKSWVRIFGVSAEVRIWYRLNKIELYRSSRLALRMCWMKYACTRVSCVRSFWRWVMKLWYTF